MALAFFASPGKAYLKKQQSRRVAAVGIDKPITTPSSQSKPAYDSLAGYKIVFDADGKPAIVREALNEDGSRTPRGPPLGLPDDPGQDLDEMMEEIAREVEVRRERGMSLGQGLKDVVQAKVRVDQSAGSGAEKNKIDPRVDSEARKR